MGSQVLKLTDWILKNFGDNAGLDMSWQPESNGSLLCKWRITFGDFLSWQPKRNGSLLCKRRITFGDFLSILWVDNQKEMVHYFVKEGLLLAIFCPFYCKKGCIIHYIFFYTKITLGEFCPKSASKTHCDEDVW